MAPKYNPCEITLEFGDGEYLFRLPLKQIAELQEKCGAGIGAIYQRVLTGQYKIEDCVETIRLGLIGGGVPAVPARVLVNRYAEEMPKQFLWEHATSILSACIVGYLAPELASFKKKDPEPVTGPKRKRASSASARPTATSP